VRRMQMTARKWRIVAVLCFAGAAVLSAAAALGQGNPLNDLLALGQGSGDTPATVPIVRRAEPPLVPTPLESCGPGSHEQPGVDGRVPEGSAKDGLNCNIKQVAHQGTEGGFKVYRYVDAAGHDCAYYDSTLMLPFNALNPGAGSVGVIVLDMSDPEHPKKTDTLTEPAMLTPHESLNVNTQRGLIAAVSGNLSAYPGWVSIYDASADCRHPVLQSSSPIARLGHESGFTKDGKTFYATSVSFNQITAIDVTDPKSPHPIWEGNIDSHGMTLSDDGNRAYIADTNGNMLILDTSEIQARKPNPQAREISRLTWQSASIPQNAIPFTENGHPYVLEFDEYTQGTTSPDGDKDAVGAGRIIDIADETKPVVVSNLRLQIDQPAEHHAATEAGDPGTNNPAQGYAAHYCNVPTQVNPKVVACSFIASGLRVFDISDLAHPKEMAYYVAPPQPRSENGYTNSDFAMSQPIFVAERREIWWTDGTTGFYVLRVDPAAWQAATGSRGNVCAARTRARHLHVRKRKAKTIKVRLVKGGRAVRGATVRLRGPGFSRRAKTNRKGRAVFSVLPSRSGRATVSTRYCGGRLRVSASRSRAARPHFAG
jgi:LVIVD repeat